MKGEQQNIQNDWTFFVVVLVFAILTTLMVCIPIQSCASNRTSQDYQILVDAMIAKHQEASR